MSKYIGLSEEEKSNFISQPGTKVSSKLIFTSESADNDVTLFDAVNVNWKGYKIGNTELSYSGDVISYIQSSYSYIVEELGKKATTSDWDGVWDNTEIRYEIPLYQKTNDYSTAPELNTISDSEDITAYNTVSSPWESAIPSNDNQYLWRSSLIGKYNLSNEFQEWEGQMSEPVLMTGIPGDEGTASQGRPGDYIEQRYRCCNKNVTPEAPTVNTPGGNDGNWSLTMPEFTSDTVMWMSNRKVIYASSGNESNPWTAQYSGNWSNPIPISGVNGTNGTSAPQIVMGYKRTNSNSVDSLRYNGNILLPTNGNLWLSGEHYNDLDGGWCDSPENSSAGKEYLWMISNYYTAVRRSNDRGGVFNKYTVTGEWSTPICLTGEKGEDGVDGKSIEFMYKLSQGPINWSLESSNNPKDWDPDETVTINEQSYIPKRTPDFPFVNGQTSYEGWTDNPQGIDNLNTYEYVSQREYNGTEWGKFSEPVVWSKWGEDGLDGDGVEYIFYASEIESFNTNPANWANDEDYQTSEYIRPNTPWTDNPSGVSIQTPCEYVSIRKFQLPTLDLYDSAIKDVMNDDSVYLTEALYASLANGTMTYDDIMNVPIYTMSYPWLADSNVEIILRSITTNKNDISAGKKIWMPYTYPKLWAKYGRDGQASAITIDNNNENIAVLIDDTNHIKTNDMIRDNAEIFMYDNLTPSQFFLSAPEPFYHSNELDTINTYTWNPSTNSYTVRFGFVNGQEISDGRDTYTFTGTIIKDNGSYTRSTVVTVFGIHETDIPKLYQLRTETNVVKTDPQSATSYIPSKINFYISYIEEGVNKFITTYDTNEFNNEGLQLIINDYTYTTTAVNPTLTYQLNGNNVSFPITAKLMYNNAVLNSSIFLDSETIQLVSDGAPGADGKAAEYIYCYTDTMDPDWHQLGDPTSWSSNQNYQTDDYPFIGLNGANVLNNNWTDNPSGVDETNKYEFISVRIYDSSTETWGQFSEPALWSAHGKDGKDGDGIEYIYKVFDNSTLTDAQISAALTIPISQYNRYFENPEIKPTGWNDNPIPTLPAGSYQFSSIRKYKTLTQDVFDEWSSIISEAVLYGTEGYETDRMTVFGTLSTIKNLLNFIALGTNDIDAAAHTIINKLESLIGEKIWYPYSTPSIWSSNIPGSNGEAAPRIVMLYKRTGSNATSSYGSTPDISNNVTTVGNNDWIESPGNADEGAEYLWMTSNYYTNREAVINKGGGNVIKYTVTGEWSIPVCLTGEAGQDGVDGTDIEFIYLRTNQPEQYKPSVPQGSNGNNQVADWPFGEYRSENAVLFVNGTYINNQSMSFENRTNDDLLYNVWTDNPLGVTSTYLYEYSAIRKKENKTWSQFGIPFLWSKYGENGVDGDGIEYIYYLCNEPNKDFSLDNDNYPASWYVDYHNTSATGKNNKRYDDDEYIGPSNSIWEDDPSGVTASNQYEYVSTRKGHQGNWGPFTEPTLWARYGKDGEASSVTIDSNNENIAVIINNSNVVSSDNAIIENANIYMYDNLEKVNFSLTGPGAPFIYGGQLAGKGSTISPNSYYWDASAHSYTIGFKFNTGQTIADGRLSYTFTGNYLKDGRTNISRQTTIKVIGIHESDVPTLYQLRPTANVVKWTGSSYIPNTIYTYISYIENGENQIMKYYDSSKFGNNQLSLYVNNNRIDNIFANNDSLQILTSNYLINNSSIYVELKYNDILLDSENIPCIQDGLQGPKGDNSYVLDWTNDQINLAVDSEGYIKPRQVKYTTLNLNSLNGVFGNNPQFYAYWGETLNSSFVTPANETIRNLFSIPNNSSYSGIYKHTQTSSASSAATGTKIKFKNASNINSGAVQCTAYIAVDGKFNKSNAKIPENGIDVPMIIQVWGNNKETTQTKILRVCGQHIGEDGIDGIDGQNTVTYEINPSVNSIKKSGSNYNPSSLSYTLIKYDGESVSQVSSWPTSLTTKWKWIKDDNGEQYDNNSILSPIPSTSYINLELLSGSTVIDRETIPIISDGNTGQNATQYEIIPSSSAIIKTSSTVFDPMSISLKVIKHNGNTISSFTPSSSNGLIDSSKAVSYTCAGNNTKYLYKGPISLNNCISGTPATGSLTCYVHNNSTTGGTVISSTTIPIIPEGPQGFTGPIVRMRGEWDGWAKYTSSGTSGTGTNAYTYNEGDYVVDFTSTFPSSCNTPQKKYNYAQEHSANRLSQKYCSGKTHTTNSPIYDGTDPIYLDIVYYNNKYWVPNPDTDLKWFNTTVTEIGTNNVGGAHGTSYLNGWASPGTGNYWIEATQFDFVATKLLYADQALINQLTTHELIATKSNGYPVAGITSGSKAQGQNGTLMSSLDPDNNSTITSQVYASENISAGVNDPSNVRIFAGEIYDSGENSYSLTYAPFNVRQDGTTYMSKANIVGDVNIGENVNIGGNVNIYGEHVNISGDITANTLTLSSENTFFYNRQVNLPYFNIGENKVIYAMFYLNNSNSTALAIKPYNDTYLWMASENGLTHTDNPGEAIKVDDKKLYTLYSGYGQNPVRSGNPNEKFWIVTKSDLFIKKNESAPIITDTTVYEDLDSTELSHIIISEIQFYYNGYSVNPNGGNPVWNNQIAMVRLSGFNSTNISSSVTRTYGTSSNQTTLTFYKTGNIYVSINVPNTICEKSQVSPSSTVYDVTQFGHKTQYSGDNTIQLPFDTHNYTTNNQIWFGVGDMDEGALNYEIWVGSQHGDEVAEDYFKNAISINSISIEYKRT